MITKELALTICEMFQKDYTKRPIGQTMRDIENLIDKHRSKQLILSGVINWVAVSERLPTEQTDVITYSKEFEVRNGRCMQKGSWFVNGYSRLVNVTHWAELPKPPCL